MNSAHQNELLAFHQRSEPTPAAKAFLKRTFQEFVLEYGWCGCWYESAELPKRFALGTSQECHKNATDLMLAAMRTPFYDKFPRGQDADVDASRSTRSGSRRSGSVRGCSRRVNAVFAAEEQKPGTFWMNAIPIGRYRHYKGNEYTVIGVARHSETQEEMVVYRQEYGDYGLWVRPKAMFFEMVEVNGKTLPRFQYLGPK